MPSIDDLTSALHAAGSAHHDYETHYLDGIRDEQWPGWYAAYVLGRLGDFVSATTLSHWLESAPLTNDWAATTAQHVLNLMQPD